MSENVNKKPNAVQSTARDFGHRMGIVGELFQFLWTRKLWWMIPMVVMLVLFGILFIFAQAAGTQPFIYTLF